MSISWYHCAAPGRIVSNSNCSWHYLLKWAVGASNPNGTHYQSGTNLRVVLKESEVMTPGMWSLYCVFQILYSFHVTTPTSLSPGSIIYMSSNATAALKSITVST
jgi:hypothetical protein